MPPPPSRQSSFLLQNLEWAKSLSLSLVKDEHLAEDIFQETMVAGLANPPAESHPQKRLWLAGVLKNRLRMYYRSSQRRVKREDLCAPEHDGVEVSVSPLEQKEVVLKLREAVDKLEEPLRGAMRLRYWENHSLAQIAEEHEVPLRTIETRLRRGRALVRKELTPEKENLFSVLWPLLVLGLGRKAVSPSSFFRTGNATVNIFSIALFLVLGLSFLMTQLFGGFQETWEHADGSLFVSASTSQKTFQDDPINTLDRSAASGHSGIAPPEIQAHDDLPSVVFQTVEDKTAAPIPGVEIEVQQLAYISLEQASRIPTEDFMRIEGHLLRLVSADQLTSNENGEVELMIHAHSDVTRVLPGSRTPTHSLIPGQQACSLAGIKDLVGSNQSVKIAMAPRQDTLEGRVLDMDGNPVQGAHIEFWTGLNWNRTRDPEATFRVNPDGSFQIMKSSIRGAGFVIRPSAAGWVAPYQYAGYRRSMDNMDYVELQLMPAETVNVLVRNEALAPLSRVKVTYNVAGGIPGKDSLSHGNYTPSPYDGEESDESGLLCVQQGKGKGTALVFKHVMHKALYKRTKPFEKELDVVLYDSKILKGQVFDAQGQGVQGVKISVIEQEIPIVAMSDADGDFQIALGDFNGVLKLHATSAQGDFAWETVDLDREHDFVQIRLLEGKNILAKLESTMDEAISVDYFPWETSMTSYVLGESPLGRDRIQDLGQGRVNINSLPPGEYFLLSRSSEGDFYSNFAYSGGPEVELLPGIRNGRFGGVELQLDRSKLEFSETNLSAQIFRKGPAGGLKGATRVVGGLRFREGVLKTPLLASGDYVICLAGKMSQMHQHRSVTIIPNVIEKEYIAPYPTEKIRIELELGDLRKEDLMIRAYDLDGNSVPQNSPQSKSRKAAILVGKLDQRPLNLMVAAQPGSLVRCLTLGTHEVVAERVLSLGDLRAGKILLYCQK